MTRRTITLMQELPHFLRGCTLEELYQLARALRDDLGRRGRLSMLEADALVAVLLDEARVEHREIFSADCTCTCDVSTLLHGRQLVHHRPPCPAAENS